MIYAKRGTKNLPANNRVLNLYVVHNGRRQQGFQNCIIDNGSDDQRQENKTLASNRFLYIYVIHP